MIDATTVQSATLCSYNMQLSYAVASICSKHWYLLRRVTMLQYIYTVY
jgi:hypothetical protein